MEKISLGNSPVTGMKNISKGQEQNSKYKVLNPQALKNSLYDCFNNICDSSPICPDACYDDNCDC